jgi:uncharacterized pyridoxamine 5'-phosphate oxidase family protein
MKNVVGFLTRSQVQYLATIGADARPKVRPFQFMLEHGGRLYFCTSSTKQVHEEMQANPYVELCASGEDCSWLRLSGRVQFSEDAALKAKVLEASPLVKSIYQTPDNPILKIFCLADAVATIADFSGAPARTIRLISGSGAA